MRREAARALAWQLMIVVRRLAPTKVSGAPKPEYERIVPALQHMAESFSRPVDVPRLARLCHLSTPHFRRVFGKTVGQSPREYWLALRLRLAASLLRESSLSILEISHRVGFETLSSFNRLFRAHFGKPPRSWRRGGAD